MQLHAAREPPECVQLRCLWGWRPDRDKTPQHQVAPVCPLCTIQGALRSHIRSQAVPAAEIDTVTSSQRFEITNQAHKIDSPIAYPLTIDMGPYLTDHLDYPASFKP